MPNFTELSLILFVAIIVGTILKFLKQPLIIGYIITGILVGPYAFGILKHVETIELFSKIGITALLFIIGLGLNPRVIKDVGVIAFVTGIGQIIFTSLGGYFIAVFLGYSTVEALYIAVALTFSSTIIILKLLTDKGDVQKLYGRISIGFLLVQDLVAALILVGISAFAGVSNSDVSPIFAVAYTLFKGFLLLIGLLLFSTFVLNKLNDFFAKSQELLFLFSLSWGLGIAALYYYLGLSIEIGALVAGVSLSMTPYIHEITSRLKPLRDFFIIMFFILLGSQMTFTNISSSLPAIIVFTAFILIGNPLIVLLLMNIFGYTRKTGFMSGLTVAQISEFSLILIALGVSVGQLGRDILSMVTVVGILTIAGSTYLIMYSHKIYPYISKYLGLFERNQPKPESDILGSYEVVLFGCNRVGHDFLLDFKHLGPSFLVVDFDPSVVKHLEKLGVNHKYGDASDAEFLEEISISSAKLVISTIPDFDTNSLLVSKIRATNKESIIILISYSIEESLRLYELGASYVILPHFIGGHYASHLSKLHGYNFEKFENEKQSHIDYLKTRLDLGHSHPKHSLI